MDLAPLACEDGKYRQTKVLTCNIFASLIYLITGTRVLLGARISRL